MTNRGSLLLVALLVAGCGGSVTGAATSVGGSGGTAGGGGTGGVIVQPEAGPDAQQPDSGFDATFDAPADAVNDYYDPGCPDAAPPPVDKQCHLFTKPSGCPSGEGCYPYVQYPAGPCQQEQYGTMCQPVGTGRQGTPCGGGDCAAGFVCVVTGAGDQCVQLCHLKGPNDCPSGLVCVPIDSDGYGGCD